MKPSRPKTPLQEAIISCLSGISIFSDLEPDELDAVSGQMHVSRIEAGNIVFNEGDPGRDVCFIVDGTLDVIKILDDDTEKIIAVTAPGGAIGEMAVIGDFPRTATVRAHTDSTLLTLSRDRFDQICDEHPRIGVKMLRALSRLLSHHLRDTSRELFEQLSEAS